jgi:hypothetical protein
MVAYLECVQIPVGRWFQGAAGKQAAVAAIAVLIGHPGRLLQKCSRQCMCMAPLILGRVGDGTPSAHNRAILMRHCLRINLWRR